MEGKINGALINPSMISEAFKRFGISDSDGALLIVLVHPKEETQHMSDIIAKVDGQQIPVEDVSMLTDPAKIKKDGNQRCHVAQQEDMAVNGMFYHLFCCTMS
ncbi:EKC/KEOPS complex subunit TPRKB-like [Oncorhynchus kisutch]|uniref:EKC/KEOPS complex subunit TPRKB-like n=1 Tax=Oncorhynchus kisutch TaxID=8019 RepID=UPI0009A08CBF|nr:EKC/KEOPS complex subunit TPRKB-like [Oncorhynchus kisutch]